MQPEGHRKGAAAGTPDAFAQLRSAGPLAEPYAERHGIGGELGRRQLDRRSQFDARAGCRPVDQAARQLHANLVAVG